MKKGTLVEISAKVASGYYSDEAVKIMLGASIVTGPEESDRWSAYYGPIARRLVRIELDPPVRGIVVGKAHRKTGIRHGGNRDIAEVGYLTGVESHSVVMVQPIHTSRWLKPYACLEADVKEVTDE